MASKKYVRPSKYAKKRYNISDPVDFEVAVKYSGALMAAAGADGDLSEAELQWLLMSRK